jgi:hypothetical protein
LVNYLETLTKPRSMTVEGFVNWLTQGNGSLRQQHTIPWPRSTDGHPNKEVEQHLFPAMPITWQTNFLQVNAVSTASVLELQQCISQER